MLVLARKYNDIFYAISTDEWNQSNKHYLLMLTDRLDVDVYPMESLFDRVFTVHTNSNIKAKITEIRRITEILNGLDYNIVTISNLAIVENLYVLSRKKSKEIILLEDGVMNYFAFVPSKRLSKRIAMILLGINEKKIHKKISYTYLLNPIEAKYYFGRKKSLTLKGRLFADHSQLNESLRGKSIFVGQDLYRYGHMTIEEYSKIVNMVIEEKKIDYYLPHNMSTEGEKINCKVFNVIGSKATLEIYASVMDFTIYSFSSSVLYTTKLINPNIKTVAIKSCKNVLPASCNIIVSCVDEIIDVQSIKS